MTHYELQRIEATVEAAIRYRLALVDRVAPDEIQRWRHALIAALALLPDADEVPDAVAAALCADARVAMRMRSLLLRLWRELSKTVIILKQRRKDAALSESALRDRVMRMCAAADCAQSTSGHQPATNGHGSGRAQVTNARLRRRRAPRSDRTARGLLTSKKAPRSV